MVLIRTTTHEPTSVMTVLRCEETAGAGPWEKREADGEAVVPDQPGYGM